MKTAGRLVMLVLAGLALVALPAGPSRAVQPNEVLDDPAQEARARDISTGLRCLVCQNQSIDDSDAPLARDLRLLVRERIKKGDTNAEVIDYVVARYGEFVLLKPPFKLTTLFLWLGPLLVLLGGIWLVFYVLRSHRADGAVQPVNKALSDEEQRRLDELLKSSDG